MTQPSPREFVKNKMEEFDTLQRLFLAGKYHSTQFNKWFYQAFSDYNSFLREQMEGMKRSVEQEEAALQEHKDEATEEAIKLLRDKGYKIVKE